MTTPDLSFEEPDLEQAVRVIADARLGAVTLLTRTMKIPFAAASAFLDDMEHRGIVGPAQGSRSRDVYVRLCNRCGRLGIRGFYLRDADWRVGNRYACTSRNACEKRASATQGAPGA